MKEGDRKRGGEKGWRLEREGNVKKIEEREKEEEKREGNTKNREGKL